MSPEAPATTTDGSIRGFDHVALPMQNTEAMVSFYQTLGLEVRASQYLVQVYIGNQMLNFHRPELWQRDFSLRAPAATPPCGDICLVWDGTADSLTRLLDRSAIPVEAGPVEREGGRRAVASSVYVRDPDGNLVEFMRYGEGDPLVS
jgi:catechol 2,3-dioxygenase-like lactoylglutathione lyase family enzyme